jgi:hypothetical protein
VTCEEFQKLLYDAKIWGEVDEFDCLDNGNEIRCRLRFADFGESDDEIAAALPEWNVEVSEREVGCDTCGYGTTAYLKAVRK